MKSYNIKKSLPFVFTQQMGNMLDIALDSMEEEPPQRMAVRGSAAKTLEEVDVPEGAAQRKGTTYVSNAFFWTGHFMHSSCWTWQ